MKFFLNKNYVFLTIIFSGFSYIQCNDLSHNPKLEIQNVNSEMQSDKSAWVTVYVHGTMTKMGIKFLGKFCPEVCYGAPGIHHMNNMPEQALFKADVEKLCNGDSKRFSKEHFYTFGWSGSLSFAEREKAGKALYDELKKLLEDYKNKYNFYPRIRIMTFSHGGNVALNMVSNLPFLAEEHIYLELLIIACPVQKVTEYLIENSEVDFIYTIASTRDLLQVADNYKYNQKRYFPKRFFETNKKNCCQMKVFVNNRGLGHIDLLRSFMVHIPDCLNIADSYLLAETVDLSKSIKTDTKTEIIDITIQDDKFCFYKGYNLISSIYGKRKK